MKTNLSNRPIPKIIPLEISPESQEQYEWHIVKTEKWFEAFEKELREIIKACEEQTIQGENQRIHLQSRIEAFKELLGE